MFDPIELRKRMKRAIKELDKMADEIREDGVDAERHIHLKSKTEGVKLALGYLEDEIKRSNE